MFRESICAVTTCVGYGDFLRESALWNAPHFDRWVVVTSKDDHETQDVCRTHRLTCLITEDCTRDGAFSKGRLVERGLMHLPEVGWVCHVDADIVIPTRFRERLELAHLRPQAIHGCDRILVHGEEAWKALQKSNWLRGKDWHPTAVSFPAGYPVGTRWAAGDGYVPIGFFQLWNRVAGGEERYGCRTKPYPAAHGGACRTDTQFAHYWDRRDRVLIPELVVAHLESGPAPLGANWKGRKTARFGPPYTPRYTRPPS